MRASNSSDVSTFVFFFTSLFIQPDKQTLNGVFFFFSGDSKSSVSVTNQTLTQLHINFCSYGDRYYHLPILTFPSESTCILHTSEDSVAI